MYLLHIDLFGLVSLRSINHEKYTLVIVDEYSRYTWVYFLKKKSQAPEIIISFIRRVENLNDLNVKQLRTDNGTEFRNSTLVNFYDERGISQNFSLPYTPKQNGVAERRNRSLIEATITMLVGSVFLKQFWTEAVTNVCYTQRGPLSSEKFDAKADDGYFLGYSLVSKAFNVFNTIRQQIEETFYITFDESTEAIMFSQPSVEDITIVESERLPTDEYLHAFEPSKRYQVNSDIFQYVQPYVKPKSTVTEADATTG
ncbi:retrovirus-related pol polyprotein from transposon TNT 1-94 [Tanacetum coccineum]